MTRKDRRNKKRKEEQMKAFGHSSNSRKVSEDIEKVKKRKRKHEQRSRNKYDKRGNT